MDAALPVIILLSLTWFLNPLQAVFDVDNYRKLMVSLETHLNGSSVDFDTWSNKMSLELEKEMQERVAFNVNWTEIPQTEDSLVKMQHLLKPSNSLKLRLWMCFYKHLNNTSQLSKTLRTNFAWELRDLQRNHPKKWNYDLQSMWQSLPRFLRIVTQSQWLCLMHKKEMFYVTAGYHLELGANDNCSLWQVQEEREDYLLLLVNLCYEERYFFVNILEDYNGSYQLLRPTSYMNNTFCVHKGLAYFRESSQVSPSDLGCQWKLNDCSGYADYRIK